MAALPTLTSTLEGVVVWAKGAISCRCLHVAADHIEILVVVQGVTVERTVFTDHVAASDFAISKMRAYDAP